MGKKTRARPKIRILHWEELDPFSVKARVADFVPNHRFQMVALEEDLIVGYWMFQMPTFGGSFIESTRTQVLREYRMFGIASALWLAGIERYSARRVTAMASSWGGCALIAKMTIDAWIMSGTRVVLRNSANYIEFYNERVRDTALAALDQHRGSILADKAKEIAEHVGAN